MITTVADALASTGDGRSPSSGTRGVPLLDGWYSVKIFSIQPSWRVFHFSWPNLISRRRRYCRPPGAFFTKQSLQTRRAPLFRPSLRATFLYSSIYPAISICKHIVLGIPLQTWLIILDSGSYNVNISI